MYIYIYTYTHIHTCVCIYIYIYIKSPPWINKRPPPYLFFPPNDLFHYSLTIKKTRNIYNSGQDFINHISPLMGGPLCDNNIWDCYIINVT